MGHTLWRFTILVWTWIVLAESESPQPSHSALLGVHRYFGDKSFNSRQFACSEAEHRCLNNDTLLYEQDGRCYAVGQQGPCGQGEAFHADKAEATRLGGHLRGTCAAACGDSSKAPLSATGQCMTRAEVEAQVCRKEWYLAPAKDAFGEWVCQWSKLPCSPPDMPRGGFYWGSKVYTGICSGHNIFSVQEILNSSATNESTAAPPDHPWLRYFANYSYMEREFPCSEQQKLCLDYGGVLHSSGNCYRPNQWTRECEPGQTFHIDWEAAVAEEGSIQGTCRSPCRDYKQPLAATGECMDFGVLSNQICRWEWGMHPTQDVFGQLVCQCSWRHFQIEQPTPTLPPAASAPGLCRMPNFTNAAQPPQNDKTLSLGFSVPCTEEEHACLKQGRVLAGGACHALRTQGPCAAGEQLVLDKEALARARLLAVCKALPCPAGSVPMPIDGRCLTHEQVTSVLCRQQMVALDEFGGWECYYRSDWPGNLSSTVRHAGNGTCEMQPAFGFNGHPFGGHPAGFPGAGGGGGGGGGGFGGGGFAHPPPRPHHPRPPPPPPFPQGAGLGGRPAFHHNSVGGGPAF